MVHVLVLLLQAEEEEGRRGKKREEEGNDEEERGSERSQTERRVRDERGSSNGKGYSRRQCGGSVEALCIARGAAILCKDLSRRRV